MICQFLILICDFAESSLSFLLIQIRTSSLNLTSKIISMQFNSKRKHFHICLIIIFNNFFALFEKYFNGFFPLVKSQQIWKNVLKIKLKLCCFSFLGNVENKVKIKFLFSHYPPKICSQFTFKHYNVL